MEIVGFDNYKKFLLHKIKSLPGGGRGEMGRLSSYLRIQNSALTQTLSGPRHFDADILVKVGDYFKLDSFELEYLLVLAQLNQAEHPKLQSIFRKQLKNIAEQSEKAKEGVVGPHPLSYQDQAIFYSDWVYAAVHLACFLWPTTTQEQIAKRLGIPLKRAAEVVEFLKSTGLILAPGGSQHPKDHFRGNLQGSDLLNLSRFRPLHHRNWRIRGLDAISARSENDFFFSSTMIISEKDAELVRKVIDKAIQGSMDILHQSKGDTLRCLNIDWFEF